MADEFGGCNEGFLLGWLLRAGFWHSLHSCLDSDAELKLVSGRAVHDSLAAGFCLRQMPAETPALLCVPGGVLRAEFRHWRISRTDSGPFYANNLTRRP